MQFIFSSFDYTRQRRIIRILLGLSQDGTECVAHAFEEGNLIMTRPYFIYTLLEFLDNGKFIRSAENMGKQILSTATSE